MTKQAVALYMNDLFDIYNQHYELHKRAQQLLQTVSRRFNVPYEEPSNLEDMLSLINEMLLKIDVNVKDERMKE